MSTAIRAPEPVAESTGLPETVPALFQRTAAQRPDAPALFFKAGTGWVPINWREYARAVSRLGNALVAEGLQPQDRVAVWSANRPEWQISDLAILHAGLVTVAIYQTLAPDQVKYLLSHSESKVLIVDDRKLLDQLLQMREELPALRRVILIEGENPGMEDWVISWEQALRRGDEFGRGRPGLLASRWQTLQPDDTASLIYTSGTTGVPKAAILTHRNLTWTATATLQCFRGDANDRVVSYLPLAHILERVVSHLRQLCTGCQVYFCPSVDKVMEVVHDVHPTYFTSVPRLWEKIYGGIRDKMDRVKGPRRLVRDWALLMGALRTAAYERGRAPSPLVRWQWSIADRLVFRKIRETLGFDKIQVCVSGSAAVSPDMLRFFYGLGIGQAVVLGDGRPFVAALLTLDRDSREARGGPDDPAVKRLVDEAVASVNHGLSHPEQIKKWKILDADFVIGDELTPSMKVKRKRIAEKYRSEIEALYAAPKTA